MCGKYKEPVAFFNKKTFYVYSKKKITAEHCSQNWRISQVKSKGIQCLKKLDMTADFSVLVAFIRLTSELIRAYFCFSVTYFNVRPLSCWTAQETSLFYTQMLTKHILL